MGIDPAIEFIKSDCRRFGIYVPAVLDRVAGLASSTTLSTSDVATLFSNSLAGASDRADAVKRMAVVEWAIGASAQWAAFSGMSVLSCADRLIFFFKPSSSQLVKKSVLAGPA